MGLPQAEPEQDVDVPLPRKKVTLEAMKNSAVGLSDRLNTIRIDQYPDTGERKLRKFTSGEAAKLIGVDDSYLRQLALEGKGPQVEVLANNRRLYSANDIHEIRHLLAKTGKAGRKYLKHRSEHEHLQVISCVNFKGGSAKTTTCAHLAQYLALHGYRVLAIDLDPQASLTALHGYQPELDVGANQSLYGTIRYLEEERVNPADVIRKTYIPGLDLIPAHLELMEFEHETPKVLVDKKGAHVPFFHRIGVALADVADDYDVVLIDCPPQLGFLTLSALSASTALVITVHPQMLDLMSMSQFLNMASELLGAVRDAGGSAEYDWLRYLPTRYDASDKSQESMLTFMREQFGEDVCKNVMVKSAAISDAGIAKQTIYEPKRDSFSRSTIDRALEVMNSVNAEIEEQIMMAWGRI